MGWSFITSVDVSIKNKRFEKILLYETLAPKFLLRITGMHNRGIVMRTSPDILVRNGMYGVRPSQAVLPCEKNSTNSDVRSLAVTFRRPCRIIVLNALLASIMTIIPMMQAI